MRGCSGVTGKEIRVVLPSCAVSCIRAHSQLLVDDNFFQCNMDWRTTFKPFYLSLIFCSNLRVATFFNQLEFFLCFLMMLASDVMQQGQPFLPADIYIFVTCCSTIPQVVRNALDPWEQFFTGLLFTGG